MLNKIILYGYGLVLFVSLLIENVYLYSLFWIFMTILLTLKYGYQSDRSYLKNYVIRIVIISILSYAIIAYGLGLIFGFSRNIFSMRFITMMKNILPVAVMVICSEIIRYIYAKNCKNVNLKLYVYISLALLVLELVTQYYGISLNSGESIFVFITTILIPKFCINLLCTYVTYKVSYMPSLLLRLIFNIYIYVLPILPNIGDYLNSVIGVLLPFIIYKSISELVYKYDKMDKYVLKVKKRIVYFPLILILLVLVFLVSGIGKFQIVAIGSGSMEPVIYRGDAVLIDKGVDASNFIIGDVLAFKYKNTLITHRIVGLDRIKSKYYFKTKGDNNDDIDDYVVTEDDIVGRVMFNIKYVGYPTIELNELFGNL